MVPLARTLGEDPLVSESENTLAEAIGKLVIHRLLLIDTWISGSPGDR